MSNLYADIARRTGGDIYIGVVGPVRTGKSTLIKRIMEELVIPNIEDLYQRERARDELPQSGSGRTIMTAEPKFVPEEAVEITPDGTARLSVRLIDSVGYLVDGAIGATENGQPRMVTTPWADTELPMEEAAELGTRKVMEEHSTVGLVVTTDGSITDIPRADYREAEARAIRDMQATGKPFLVVVNSAAPNGGQAQALRCELEETYGVHAVTADCQSLHEAELGELLRALLYTFPMREVRVFLPAWVRALELEHPLKAALYSALRENAAGIACLADAEPAPRRGRKGAAPGAEAARTKAPRAEAGEARRKETCGKAAQGAARRKGPAQSGARGGVRQADGRPAPAGGALSEDPKEKADCQKTNQAKSFRGKKRVKGNRQGALSRLIASRGGTF